MTLRPSYAPTLQELRALLCCADLGSASEAGLALNLTQSAVSRSIRSLEDRLGVRLFHREKQRLVLSDAGRAMVRDARDILMRVDASARMVMAFGAGADVLRLGVLPTFATTWLIPRLPDFSARHPDVCIDIGAALAPVDFADSAFDAALQRAGMARPGTEVIPVMAERLIVVAAPRLVGRASLAPEAVLKHPLIQQATRPELWSDWFGQLGLDPFGRLRGPRFEHFDMVLAAAEAGLGIAILPAIFAASALAAGRLVQASPAEILGRSPYALIFPARSAGQRSLGLFTRWLRGRSEVSAAAGS